MSPDDPLDSLASLLARAAEGVDVAAELEQLPSALKAEARAALEAQELVLGPSTDRRVTDGEQLGRFLVVALLGRGGQGDVYRAFDPEAQEEVALKVLAGRWTGTRRRRLEREVELATRLDHPALCRVRESGTLRDARDRERAYLAMDLVEGRSLAEDAGDSPPDAEGIRRAVSCLVRLADGLSTAHAAGVVHRDVKPGNVRLDGNGDPVLVDFGLAFDEEGSHGSLTGEVPLGTPAYMAPEAIVPAGRRPDARADVWSLGATLYELVCGTRPFASPTREGLFHAILSREVRPARQVNPRVSTGLELVLETCLRKEADRRYADAGKLRDDLERILAGQPPVVRRPGLLARGATWIRRHPVPALLLLVTSLSSFTSLELLRRSRRDGQRIRSALAAEEAQRLEAESAGRRARGARLLAEARNVGRRSPGLALALARRGIAESPAPLARETVLDALAGRFEERLFDLGAPVHDVAFAPDGQSLTVLCSDRITIFDVEGEGMRSSLELPGARCFVQGDGLFVGLADGSLVRVEAGGEFVPLGAPSRSEVTSMALHPSGPWLVAGYEDGSLAVLDTLTGERRPVPFSHGGAVQDLRFDSTGRLWSAADDHTARGFEVDGSGDLQELHTFQHPWRSVEGLCPTPDGRELLVASADNRLWMWNLEEGERRTFQMHASAVMSVDVSPGGGLAVTTSFDRSALLWDLEEDQPLARLEGHGRALSSACFSPDETWIATGSHDGSVRLWRSQGYDEARSLQSARAPGDASFAVHISAGAQRLATSGIGPGAALFDLTTGRIVAELTDGSEGSTWCTFTPDGHQLLCISSDRGVVLRDGSSGELLARNPRPFQGSFASLLPPDEERAQLQSGRRSICIDSSGTQALVTADGERAVWLQLPELRPVAHLRGQVQHFSTGSVGRSTFSEDRQSCITTAVATGEVPSTGEVVRWSREGEVLAGQAVPGEVLCLERQGSLLAVGLSQGEVWLLDEETLTPVNTFVTGSEPVTAVRFAPGGEQLAWCTGDGAVGLASIARGEMEGRLEGHESVVYDLRYSPDGRHLLSSSWDGNAILWDARTRERLVTQRAHEGPVFGARFESNEIVWSVGLDDRLRSWPVDPLEFVRRLPMRALLPEERDRHGIE